MAESLEAQMTGLSLTSFLDEEDEEVPPRPMAPDLVSLYQTWRYPVGQTIPVIFLYMNHYVDRNYVYIPCEIGVAAFTIEEGLRGVRWTLVDPGEIPIGHGVEAGNNAHKYGVPQPGFSVDFQDYKKIVTDLESFFETHRSCLGSINIYCSKRSVAGYTASLKWLYGKANAEFPHKIGSLEKLLVTLSLTGLDCIVRDGNFEKTLPETVNLYHETMFSCESARSLSDEDAKQNEIASSINSFIASTRISVSSYYSIGKSVRVASTQAYKYPAAMLGAFLFESEAEEYMSTSAYIEREELACNFHREKLPMIGLNGRKMVWGMDEEHRPRNRLIKCALTNVLRQMYLALDVMLVNYSKVVPKRKRHYPFDGTSSSSSSSPPGPSPQGSSPQ